MLQGSGSLLLHEACAEWTVTPQLTVQTTACRGVRAAGRSGRLGRSARAVCRGAGAPLVAQRPAPESALRPAAAAARCAGGPGGGGLWAVANWRRAVLGFLPSGGRTLSQACSSRHCTLTIVACKVMGVQRLLACAFGSVLSVAGILYWIPSKKSVDACRTCTRAGAHSMMRTTQLLTAWKL